MNYNKSEDLRVHHSSRVRLAGGEKQRIPPGIPYVSEKTLLALSLVPLSAQHLALLVLAHLLAAFFDDTAHAIPSIHAPVGASGR